MPSCKLSLSSFYIEKAPTHPDPRTHPTTQGSELESNMFLFHITAGLKELGFV
jgi:hypothetical protein